MDNDTVVDALTCLISRGPYADHHSYALREEMMQAGYSSEHLSLVHEVTKLARDSANVRGVAESLAAILEDRANLETFREAAMLHALCEFKRA